MTSWRIRESKVDYVLRTEVWPRIEGVAGHGGDHIIFYTDDHIVGPKWDTEQDPHVTEEVILQLQARGYKVTHGTYRPHQVRVEW